MGGLKSLAKDTAIYGVSSIVGRFLNYLLVPIYTISMPRFYGRIWYYYEYVCHYGTSACTTYMRYGNRIFPFCQ